MLNNEQSLAYADNRVGYGTPYGQSINPTAAPQINNIEALEQQIAMVKERIARNKRALVDMKGVTDRVGNLEFKKINSTDPSTIWRWREQQKDMREANASVKADEQARFRNTVDMWLDTDAADTKEGIDQQVANIRSAIRDGKNIGADVEPLYKKIAQLEGNIVGKSTRQEDIDAEVGGITSGKTIVDSNKIGELLKENLKAEQKVALESEMNKKKKAEDAAAAKKGYEAGFIKYLKSIGVDYNDPTMKAYLPDYRKMYDDLLKGGKK